RLTSSSATPRSTPPTWKGASSDNRNRQDGRRSEHGLRAEGAQPPRRLGPARQGQAPQADREPRLQELEERLPRRDQRRPRLQRDPAARQTRPPEDRKVKGALRRQPR